VNRQPLYVLDREQLAEISRKMRVAAETQVTALAEHLSTHDVGLGGGERVRRLQKAATLALRGDPKWREALEP
jgi:hypothetical protein